MDFFHLAQGTMGPSHYRLIKKRPEKQSDYLANIP
jgi:hypothetical protein